MSRYDDEDIYDITRRYNAKEVERKSKANSNKYNSMNKSGKGSKNGKPGKRVKSQRSNLKHGG